MKKILIVCLFLSSLGSALAVDDTYQLYFACPASGASGFWQNREEAWNLHLAGWWQNDVNWVRHYYKNFSNVDSALAGYRQALKTPLKNCIDKNTQLKAILDAEKADRERQNRLTSIEKVMDEMKRVTNELNDAYKKLVVQYSNPIQTPENKIIIEALNNRIRILEEYRKKLDV